jgi:hypothetical protein
MRPWDDAPLGRSVPGWFMTLHPEFFGRFKIAGRLFNTISVVDAIDLINYGYVLPRKRVAEGV